MTDTWRRVNIPPHWVEVEGEEDPIMDAERLLEAATDTDTVVVDRILLKDGTGLIFMLYNNGARYARMGPANDFCIEELFEGKPNTDPDIQQTWRNVIEGLRSVKPKLQEWNDRRSA